jgi:hypothetical protein
MSKYLPDTLINDLAKQCSDVLTPEMYELFKYFSNKYGFTFGPSVSSNATMLYRWVRRELDAKRAGMTAQEREAEGTIYVLNSEFIANYVQANHKKDYDYICTFDASDLMENIERSLKAYGFDTIPTFETLLTTSNYVKYFETHYGERSADKNELKATQKITDLLDSLFGNVKNKAGAVNACKTYIVNGNKALLHNALHN